MASIALLVFNRDDVEGTLRLLRMVGRFVSEIVIIDSSGPLESERLRREAEKITQVSFSHIFPLGCTEPLRAYAETVVRSDRIASIDTDEVPSGGFVRRLSLPIEEDVLFVPRLDLGIGRTMWLPRIYRPGHLHYEGWIHEEPRVLGTSAPVAGDEGLEHRADYSHYLDERGRGAAYLPIESFERPFTGREIWFEFHSWACRISTLGSDLVPPPPAVAWLLRSLHRSVLAGNDLEFMEYVRARYRHFTALPRPLRRAAVAISRDLRQHGGVTAYLGLDDPRYVERLSSGYPWNAPPEQPLVELLVHRFATGSVLKDWGELASRGRGIPT